MLYLFPQDSFATARSDYARPYETAISARKGERITPLTDGSMSTDFMGWTWCIGADGRAGWVPDSWCEAGEDGWCLIRDYSAMELSVKQGQRLRLIASESGFVFVEDADGAKGWVPDAVLAADGETQMTL